MLFSDTDFSVIMSSNRNSNKNYKLSDFYQSNILHYDKNEITSLTRPLLLISLSRNKDIPETTPTSPANQISTNKLKTSFEGPYIKSSNFYLNLGFGLTNLDKGMPKEDFVQEGQINYYTFYLDDKNLSKKILIEVLPLDNGDPDIYLAKGIESRPNMNSYLIKNEKFRDVYLHLTSNKLKHLGYSEKQQSGYYVIGVYGNTSSKYIIRWNYYKNGLHFMKFNKLSAFT